MAKSLRDKRGQAEDRESARENRLSGEQIIWLDARLGVNAGAKRERKRLAGLK